MSNSHDIVCQGNPDVSRYTCPCDYLNSENSNAQKGGECIAGHCGPPINKTSCLGAKQIPLGVNPGCPKFPPTASEIAWDNRYSEAPISTQKGGANLKHYHKYKKYKALYKKIKKN